MGTIFDFVGENVRVYDDGMRVVLQIILVLVLVLVLVEVVGHCDSFIARNYRVPISGRRAE